MEKQATREEVKQVFRTLVNDYDCMYVDSNHVTSNTLTCSYLYGKLIITSSYYTDSTLQNIIQQ